jgi:hypothetical protein
LLSRTATAEGARSRSEVRSPMECDRYDVRPHMKPNLTYKVTAERLSEESTETCDELMTGTPNRERY